MRGVMNALLVNADAVGPTLYYGAGDGAEPTASAVVADLVDVVRTLTTDPDHRVPHLAFQPDAISDEPVLDMGDAETAYYLSMEAADRPGVLAEIATILGDAGRPLFVISSKSGTTLETASFLAHFWQVARADGSRFIAITDEDSKLQQQDSEKDIRAVLHGDDGVGGRFSALSVFGIVPAALSGSDVDGVIAGARTAMEACRHPASPQNPGAWLGAVLGEAALAGRDKLTLLLPRALASFGAWVEQLVAESTGKQGTGILPVIDDGLADVAKTGTQAGLLDRMHTRSELYELIRYEDYNNYDQSVYNFKV